MKKLLVYADFDWLGQVELVGELTMDSVRGGETYGFMYDANWLKKHGDIALSDFCRNFCGAFTDVMLSTSASFSTRACSGKPTRR